MYSSATDGRTVIKIGGKALTGDRTAPLCSVPIKTTATFNIQLNNLIQNGRLDVGSATTSGDSAFGRNSTTTSEIGTSCDDDLRKRNGTFGDNGQDEFDGGRNGTGVGGGRNGTGQQQNGDDSENFGAGPPDYAGGADDPYSLGFRNRRGSNSSSDSPSDLYAVVSKTTSTGISTSDAAGFWGDSAGGSGVSGQSVMSADSAVGTSNLDDNKSSCSSGDYGDDENMPRAFNFMGWDVGGDERQPPMPCRRVLLWKDSEIALMFKACCTTEEVGKNAKFLALMGDIAENCVKRLKKMKDISLSNLHAQHLDTLPLSDGRLTKQHIDELSASVGEKVTITEVAFRFQPPEGTYLGTYVQGTVLEKRSYAIGRTGVMVVLLKKSKYATVEAFSEQLCQHIALTKPSTLGTIKLAKNSSITELEHLQRDQLLLQKFTSDATIIVAEAARRSFVKIEDFLIFK